MKKIYTDIPRQKSIRDFIFMFFTNGKLKLNTTYKSAVYTYNDEECTDVQCVPYKYRSVDDLFIIVKTVYPSCTIKKLIEILFSMTIKGNKFYFINCNDINMPTCCFSETGSPFFDFSEKVFEKSKYKSWRNLLKKVNLDTKEKYVKWRRRQDLYDYK